VTTLKFYEKVFDVSQARFPSAVAELLLVRSSIRSRNSISSCAVLPSSIVAALVLAIFPSTSRDRGEASPSFHVFLLAFGHRVANRRRGSGSGEQPCEGRGLSAARGGDGGCHESRLYV